MQTAENFFGVFDKPGNSRVLGFQRRFLFYNIHSSLLRSMVLRSFVTTRPSNRGILQETGLPIHEPPTLMPARSGIPSRSSYFWQIASCWADQIRLYLKRRGSRSGTHKPF
jgi:hypothetical protein